MNSRLPFYPLVKYVPFFTESSERIKSNAAPHIVDFIFPFSFHDHVAGTIIVVIASVDSCAVYNLDLRHQNCANWPWYEWVPGESCPIPPKQETHSLGPLLPLAAAYLYEYLACLNKVETQFHAQEACEMFAQES